MLEKEFTAEEIKDTLFHPNLCRHVVHALVKGFHAPRPATFLRLVHRQCCCFEILFVFLLFFLVIFCSLCFYFLTSSLNCLLFCFFFFTKFFLYLPTTNGWFWFLLPTTNGRDDNPNEFYSVYRILPFITASFGHLSSLYGSSLHLTHSRLFFG
jgi:hypothetical protein